MEDDAHTSSETSPESGTNERPSKKQRNAETTSGGRGGGGRGGGGRGRGRGASKALTMRRITAAMAKVKDDVKKAHAGALAETSVVLTDDHADVLFRNLKDGIPDFSKSQVAVGAWMAALVCKSYRYMNDASIMREPLVLMHFDGVLYTREAGLSNAEKQAREVARSTAESLAKQPARGR